MRKEGPEMVAHESGQTSMRSLHTIIPTPALGVDDKSRLNARGVLSAGLGRGDVERWPCGGRGGHSDQSIARNLTFSLKFQVSPCTRHPAWVYFWLCSGARLDPDPTLALGVRHIPGLISVALPHQ